jgi:hypothetical protein
MNKLSVSELQNYRKIEAAIHRLVEMGLVADTGRRKWSDKTGRYEIVWASTKLDRK